MFQIGVVLHFLTHRTQGNLQVLKEIYGFSNLNFMNIPNINRSIRLSYLQIHRMELADQQ